MENKRIERSYHIPLAMFDDAFLFFQKKNVIPQNILRTVSLLAVAALYVRSVIKNPESTF